MEVLVAYQPFAGYEAGDPIAVHPDGVRWGRKQSIDRWLADGFKAADFPTFPRVILVIEGEPCELWLMEPEEHPPDLVTGKRTRSKKRAWRFDLDALPRSVRSRFKPGGRTVGPRTWRQHFVRKVDGAGLPPRLDADDGVARARTPHLSRAERPRSAGPGG